MHTYTHSIGINLKIHRKYLYSDSSIFCLSITAFSCWSLFRMCLFEQLQREESFAPTPQDIFYFPILLKFQKSNSTKNNHITVILQAKPNDTIKFQNCSTLYVA